MWSIDIPQGAALADWMHNGHDVASSSVLRMAQDDGGLLLRSEAPNYYLRFIQVAMQVGAKNEKDVSVRGPSNDLERHVTWLRHDAPKNILKPLFIDSKHARARRRRQWSWPTCAKAAKSQPEQTMLMKGLFCLEFDYPRLLQYMQGEFPGWFVPDSYARTDKGCHIIFRSSNFCDDIGLLDTPRFLQPGAVPLRFLDAHGEIPVDVRTTCSLQNTQELVVVPSINKSWIIPPWGLPQGMPARVPYDLVHWIFRNLKQYS